VEVLRVDDPTGKTPIELVDRCKAANDWGADFCLSIHHNAFQGKPWDGGGVTAFSCPGSVKGKQYRDAIYNAVIAAGGLRGNRANPTQTKAFIALKQTKAPAVLMEYGFMDSKVDAPIILTEEYAKAVAYATMEGIAAVAGLAKKPQTTLYRVQVGAFAKREYAQAMVDKLAKAGFTGYIN
jgi:N-acetylmuramoyl-L-alanine amidase